MIQATRASFKQKAVQSILIARKLWRQEFQRHPATEVEVLRLETIPMPPLPSWPVSGMRDDCRSWMNLGGNSS